MQYATFDKLKRMQSVFEFNYVILFDEKFAIEVYCMRA